MEDLTDFERGQIVGMRLGGTSVIKTATLLGVSRATVSKVMSATRIMGRQHLRRGTVGENQHLQKEIVVNSEGLLRKITQLLQHR
jgi:predicted transcriptional regulator